MVFLSNERRTIIFYNIKLSNILPYFLKALFVYEHHYFGIVMQFFQMFAPSPPQVNVGRYGHMVNYGPKSFFENGDVRAIHSHFKQYKTRSCDERQSEAFVSRIHLQVCFPND